MLDAIHARAPRWAFALTALALAGFIAVGVVSYLNFNTESNQSGSPWAVGNPDLTDGVIVSARTLKVDTSASEITFRITYSPEGGAYVRDGRLAQPVTVELVNETGTVTKTFRTGQEMRGQDVTEPLLAGYQGDYPWDRYTTGVSALVTNREDELVPTALEAVANVHGFSFRLVNEIREPDGSLTLGLNVRRSAATRLFAIFVMVMMWALALTALGLMVRVILLGRRVEFPMFTFLAAMLFAFPAVRNAMPGAPPVGVRSDYLSFFWCEMLLAFSLIVTLGVWVIRRAAGDPERSSRGSPSPPDARDSERADP